MADEPLKHDACEDRGWLWTRLYLTKRGQS